MAPLKDQCAGGNDRCNPPVRWAIPHPNNTYCIGSCANLEFSSYSPSRSTVSLRICAVNSTVVMHLESPRLRSTRRDSSNNDTCRSYLYRLPRVTNKFKTEVEFSISAVTVWVRINYPTGGPSWVKARHNHPWLTHRLTLCIDCIRMGLPQSWPPPMRVGQAPRTCSD